MRNKNKLKINCVVCGKEIEHPRMGQETCGGDCSKAYQKAYWKTDKCKAYRKALIKLRKNHEKEFKKILGDLK